MINETNTENFAPEAEEKIVPIHVARKPRGFNNMVFRRNFVNVFIYILLALLSFIWVFPVLYLVFQSFRAPVWSPELNRWTGGLKPITNAEGFTPINYFVPLNWSIQNYINLFTDPLYPYGRWFLNTLTVAIVCAVISTIIVLLTSFAFSRLRFKGRQSLMKFIMVLGMFPGFMSMIAIYYILKGINLIGNPNETPAANYLVALVLVYTGGAAMGYFVSKGYFDTISRSIDEAAAIDGANKAQIFWHITLPLSKPIVIYTALTSFMGPWGDYIFASVIVGTKRDAASVAMGLYSYIDNLGELEYYFTRFCAGAVVIAVPITILYIFMQRYYVSGITGGAVKG